MEVPLCCPACKGPLKQNSPLGLSCPKCGKTYPVVNGIPVLIDNDQSVFSAESYLPKEGAVNKIATGGLKGTILNTLNFLQRTAPKITLNLKAKSNYNKLGKLLLQKNNKPRVLIIGGRTLGEGMEDFAKLPIDFVETDVSFGPRTKIICDAHSLPFEANYFDAVIIQAVLEYLVEPPLCVAEIHRVLKADGLVYAETPFMQQVHGREFDFMRYSYLGFRRLFRNFEQVDMGACVGSGSALAWAWKYFLLSFTSRKIVREFLLILANYTGFWLKYFDYLTINKAATLDAASGYYFLGRKSNETLSDRQLITLYKGMI